MNHKRWRKIQEVLDVVIDLQSVEQNIQLDEQCGEDFELRSELEAMIVACARSESFLEGPAFKNGNENASASISAESSVIGE